MLPHTIVGALGLILLLAPVPAMAQGGTQAGDGVILGEVGLGAPTGLLGVKLGYFVADRVDLELGAGYGASGWQVAFLGRYHFPLGADHHLTLAAGPSVALLSDAHHAVPHRKDIDVEGELYFASWMNAEIAWALHTNGVIVRAGVGLMARLAENMSHLCEGVPQGRDVETTIPNAGCNPQHTPRFTVAAEEPVFPYLTAAVGWRF